MTNTIADIETSDMILVVGSNTTENHPVLSTFVKRAVLKGKKLYVIDTRRVKLTEYAEKWLSPFPGTDIALINGLMHIIIKEDLHNKDFIEKRAENFDGLKEMVEKYTPEHVESITGIKKEDLIEVAREFAKAPAAAILYCMGITQHTCGTDNVKSLANLSILCGHLGKPGSGVNPLRGQNNVQGACDLGGLPNVFTAYMPVNNKDIKNKFEKAWNVTGLSLKPGLPVTEMIQKAYEGELKSMYIIGENPMVSDPDLNHARKAIANLDFLVVQDIFSTETSQMADVVFPAFCFAEKNGTFTNTERRVQRVRKAVDGPGESRQDWKILCDLAVRMGYEMKYENSHEIFKEIAAVTPSYHGITWERIDKIGIHWPCPDENHEGTPILHTTQFTRGKALFHAIEHQPPAEIPDKKFPYFLTTGRVLYHYHTGTMTMRSRGLNQLSPECFVEISSKDAQGLGLDNGAMVDVSSRRGKITARLKVSSKAVQGAVFIPFHFAKAAANELTNAELDPTAKIPEFKVCAINIEPAVSA